MDGMQPADETAIKPQTRLYLRLPLFLSGPLSLQLCSEWAFKSLSLGSLIG